MMLIAKGWLDFVFFRYLETLIIPDGISTSQVSFCIMLCLNSGYKVACEDTEQFLRRVD